MVSSKTTLRLFGESTSRLAICLGILITASVLLASVSHPASAQESSQKTQTTAGKTVWAGVYTQEQAKRGEDLYADHCSECHGEDLSGDTPYNPSPALAGKAFMLRWDNRTVNELFRFMRTNMPKTDPGSLSSDNYIDLVAFILRSNKLPAGDRELTQDTDALKQIVIEKDKPAGGPSVATK